MKNKLVVYYLFFLTLWLPCDAYSQQYSIQLQTARLCISEAGFQIEHPIEDYSNDCAAIVATLRNRSRTGEVTIAMLRAYTRRLFHGNTRTTRQWVSFLWLRPIRPHHWPVNLSWNRHQPRFLQVYELVGRLLRHQTEPPCSPDHWGAKWRVIQRRALRRGWHRLDCGHTFNDFWSVSQAPTGDQDD